MFDTRISKKTFIFFLQQYAKRRKEDRCRTKEKKKCPHERWSNSNIENSFKTQECEQCDVEQCAGEHCRDGYRSLTMRIGKPVVERGQAGFHSITDQEEDKSEFDECRIKKSGEVFQSRPIERYSKQPLRECSMLSNTNEEVHTKESEEKCDRVDDHILPCRLDCRRS